MEIEDVSVASPEVFSGARWGHFRGEEHNAVETDMAGVFRSCRRPRPGDSGLHRRCPARYSHRARRSFLSRRLPRAQKKGVGPAFWWLTPLFFVPVVPPRIYLSSPYLPH